MIMRSLIIQSEDRIKIIQDFAEKKSLFLCFDTRKQYGIHLGRNFTKINEDTQALTKAKQINWTEENAGLNALSRFIQSNTKTWKKFFSKDNYYIGE